MIYCTATASKISLTSPHTSSTSLIRSVSRPLLSPEDPPYTSPSRCSTTSATSNLRISIPQTATTTEGTLSTLISSTLPPSYHTRRSEPDLVVYQNNPPLLPSYASPQGPNVLDLGMKPPPSTFVADIRRGIRPQGPRRFIRPIHGCAHPSGLIEDYSTAPPENASRGAARRRRSRDGGVRIEGGLLDTEGARPPSYDMRPTEAC